MTLPGIGPERARRLLKRFGSLERCLTASAKELAAVRGVGRGTAEQIREYVTAEPFCDPWREA